MLIVFILQGPELVVIFFNLKLTEAEKQEAVIELPLLPDIWISPGAKAAALRRRERARTVADQFQARVSH